MTGSFKKQFIREISFALGGVLVLIALLFVVRGDINKRVSKIQELTGRLAARNQAAAAFVELKSAATKAQEYEQVLRSALPTEDGLINFPKAMTELGKQSGIELGVSLGGEAPALSGGLGGLNFALNTTSDYQGFVGFLKNLEAHPYFIRID